ncbi:hypothetical protein LZC94_21870 [Pendulispora albinea]|uniref:FHA domain-containing protein n=1 Tax=Pendulispora albinea TaxID=2741071 RepID=A0ABZ2MBH1_9BACT
MRDAESANGTLANGRRLGVGWTSLGDLGPCEIRIGDWVITAHGEIQAEPLTEESPAAGELRYLDFDALGSTVTAHSYTRARTGHAETVREALDSPAVEQRLSALFARYEEVALELYTQISDVLSELPPAARPGACDWLQRTLPGLAENNRGFARLFEDSRGAPGGAPAAPIERMALEGIEHLARAYVGREPATPEEIAAFLRKLHAAVSALLHGHVPLLASLDQFERQLALDGAHPFRLPRAPADLARALFDWNDPTDRASRALGRSFADVMMHHAGVLHGLMRGVKVLLAELAPEAILRGWQERQARRAPVTRGLRSLRQAQELLELYAKRHSDLSDEENEAFRLLFGQEFADEYKQFKYAHGPRSGAITAPGHAEWIHDARVKPRR